MKFADVDLNEDEDMNTDKSSGDEEEEEEEEGEDDEFINVLDVLDGKGELDNGSDSNDALKNSTTKIKRPPQQANDNGDDEGMELDESGEEYEGGDDKVFSDLEDGEPGDLDELQNFISMLDPSAKKRKDPDHNEPPTDGDRSRKQRRLTIKEQTEAGTENEFRAQSSGSSINYLRVFLTTYLTS